MSFPEKVTLGIETSGVWRELMLFKIWILVTAAFYPSSLKCTLLTLTVVCWNTQQLCCLSCFSKARQWNSLLLVVLKDLWSMFLMFFLGQPVRGDCFIDLIGRQQRNAWNINALHWSIPLFQHYNNGKIVPVSSSLPPHPCRLGNWLAILRQQTETRACAPTC